MKVSFCHKLISPQSKDTVPLTSSYITTEHIPPPVWQGWALRCFGFITFKECDKFALGVWKSSVFLFFLKSTQMPMSKALNLRCCCFSMGGKIVLASVKL